MTTIVFDYENKQIAVDGRMTNGHGVIASDSANKTIKNDAGLWFIAGAVSDRVDIVKLAHNDECKMIPDCSALLLSGGIVYLVHVNDKAICSHEELTTNESLGSGYKFAIAALDFGKSAKEAVEYAITKDCYSGGDIHVYNLSGMEVPDDENITMSDNGDLIR